MGNSVMGVSYHVFLWPGILTICATAMCDHEQCIRGVEYVIIVRNAGVSNGQSHHFLPYPLKHCRTFIFIKDSSSSWANIYKIQSNKIIIIIINHFKYVKEAADMCRYSSCWNICELVLLCSLLGYKNECNCKISVPIYSSNIKNETLFSCLNEQKQCATVFCICFISWILLEGKTNGAYCWHFCLVSWCYILCNLFYYSLSCYCSLACILSFIYHSGFLPQPKGVCLYMLF